MHVVAKIKISAVKTSIKCLEDHLKEIEGRLNEFDSIQAIQNEIDMIGDDLRLIRKYLNAHPS